MQPMLLTVRQTARELGLSRSTIYALIGSGELASVKIRSSRRVPLEAVVTLATATRG